MECPACGIQDVVKLGWRHREYTLCRCRACDLTFWDPLQDPGSDWYGEGITELTYLRPVWTPHAGVRRFLRDMPAKGGRLIDVGCGVGDFCHMAAQAGYAVTGIDYTPQYIEVARQRFPTLDLKAMTVEEFLTKRPQDKHDVATLIQVLEHVDNARDFLESVKRLLKPGGYVMCNVPNRRRWRWFSPPLREEWDYPPHHFTWWDANTLALLFRSCGFSVVTLEPDRLTPFDCAFLLYESPAFRSLARLVGRRLVSNPHTPGVSSPTPEVKVPSLFKWAYGVYVRFLPLFFGALTAPLVPLLRKSGISLYLLAQVRE